MDRVKRMIYTPVEKIPIGEVVVTENGTYGLLLKRRRKTSTVTEFIPLDKLLEAIYDANLNTQKPLNTEGIA